MHPAIKAVAFIFAAFILTNWLIAGHDNIIEGPPETPDVTLVPPSPSPGPAPEPVQQDLQ